MEPLTREGVEAPAEAERHVADETLSCDATVPTNFTRCVLSGKHSGAECRDTALAMCDLRNAQVMDLRARRIVLNECQLVGIDVSGADLSDVVCIGCRIHLGRAMGAKLTRCWFENCDLREAEFEESALEQVTFRGCDLRGARLMRSKLRGVDVRGSQIEGLGVAPDQFRGLVVSPEQTVVFAELAGLRVLPTP